LSIDPDFDKPAPPGSSKPIEAIQPPFYKNSVKKPHLFMAASTRNVILKSLLQNEMKARRSSSPLPPSISAEKSHRENDAWYIVAIDGSTRTISCKSPKASQSDAFAQAVAEELPAPQKKPGDEIPHDRDPGVDLSRLGVEKETASKLIAGINAINPDESAASLHGEIAMPSAMTDLHEMFKSDGVCMVNAPKETV
jgi:hypothetical protein